MDRFRCEIQGISGGGTAPNQYVVYFNKRILLPVAPFPGLVLAFPKKLHGMSYKEVLETHLDLEIEQVVYHTGTKHFECLIKDCEYAAVSPVQIANEIILLDLNGFAVCVEPFLADLKHASLEIPPNFKMPKKTFSA